MRNALIVALVVSCVGLAADEGMWRPDQVPLERIAREYGVRLEPRDLDSLRAAAVRILSASSGGTGTFASSNGLILTNHHVALDCIRTSSLAGNDEGVENLIEEGFTAGSMENELACRRFRVQVERSARDVTAQLEAAVKPGMDAAAIQQARQAVRSDLERACQQERGDNFTCSVTDFNSGARTLLIVWEEWKDIRLVYAPEKQLGYFGGDEMNFRFPRYASDISILRAYQAPDGRHAEYDPKNVPVKPAEYRRVTFDGVQDGDFTLVAGFPGTTNRYRMSHSAEYNVRKGMPEIVADVERELAILRGFAAKDPDQEVILQSRIFGLANTLKYYQDVLAAMRETDVVSTYRAREKELTAFLSSRPDLQQQYGDALPAQADVYAQDVEANAALDSALDWLQKSEVLNLAAGLYEFAQERAKSDDRDREPQYQERRWPDVREALLDEDPIIPALEEEFLTIGFEKALALDGDQKLEAVERLRQRTGAGAPRELARAVLSGTELAGVEARRALVDAPVSDLQASSDAALAFTRDLAEALSERRQRVRVLNEKLFMNRAKFARALAAWKGDTLYPDANFTLRITYGKALGYTDREGKPIPFATRFADLFTLADSRGNTGDFALPPKLVAWRKGLSDEEFRTKYADLRVNFVTTNDITGGNSGSATLNRTLEIVGLIFDGNREAMAGDWVYSETAGRALSTDIEFALTIAREVHDAGWIVDELMAGARQPVSAGR